jgi:AcrR family transcriptional regulator
MSSSAASPDPTGGALPGSPARERILDAAERRLLSLGPAGLVLSEVARDAGCSKGGLLYHFPSKEALVDGLTERMLDSFDRVQSALAESDATREGCWSRAYLDSTVTRDGDPADGSGRLMAGLLAQVGNEPEKLAPLRARFSAWHERLQHDGLDPETAVIVRLAADGAWLSSMLGLPGPDPALMARVVRRLHQMTGDPQGLDAPADPRPEEPSR